MGIIFAERGKKKAGAAKAGAATRTASVRSASMSKGASKPALGPVLWGERGGARKAAVARPAYKKRAR